MENISVENEWLPNSSDFFQMQIMFLQEIWTELTSVEWNVVDRTNYSSENKRLILCTAPSYCLSVYNSYFSITLKHKMLNRLVH
jgi:hypothetical protein